MLKLEMLFIRSISLAIIIFMISTILAYKEFKFSKAIYSGYDSLSQLISFKLNKQFKTSNQMSNEVLVQSDLNPISDFYYASVFGYRNDINLVDRNGGLVHQWKISDLNFADTVVPFSFEIFNNLDIIINTDTVWDGIDSSFIARLDKNSNIIWKTLTSTHHWISHYDNKIYTPIRYFKVFPSELSESIKNNTPLGLCNSLDLIQKKSWYENIQVLSSSNGEIIYEIDLLQKLSEHENVSKKIQHCSNPLHLNDVVPVTELQGLKNSSLNENDLIVSMNSPNLIVILDSQNDYKVKNYYDTYFKKQHAPRVTNHNTLLVYDNQGGSSNKYGPSRIVEIDLDSRKILGFFDGSDDIFFDSNARGYIDVIEDGVYLITSPIDFHVFIINCKNQNNFLNNNCKSEKFLVSEKGTEFNIMTKIYDQRFFN